MEFNLCNGSVRLFVGGLWNDRVSVEVKWGAEGRRRGRNEGKGVGEGREKLAAKGPGWIRTQAVPVSPQPFPESSSLALRVHLSVLSCGS